MLESVDAQPAAVGGHRSDHQLEEVAPRRRPVGPEEDLAVARAVDFDRAVALHGRTVGPEPKSIEAPHAAEITPAPSWPEG